MHLARFCVYTVKERFKCRYTHVYDSYTYTDTYTYTRACIHMHTQVPAYYIACTHTYINIHAPYTHIHLIHTYVHVLYK